MLDVYVTASMRHGAIRVRAGGTPVNAALAIGAGALVVGRIGDDPAAAAIRSALRDVDTKLTIDSDLATGTFVELADGTVAADRGANAALAIADVLPLAADAVLVSGYIARDVAAAVLERADARWRAIVATPLGGMLPAGANVVFANAEEAAQLDLSGYEIAVVTRGADGATVHRDGTAVDLPPSGDTGTGDRRTGAGDAFAGRFVASLVG